MRFWLVFGVDFTCFSHPSSNCVFAYFFLGCFSNVCTLSKHGIFKRHCFSRVKTLFWRIRLCRRNLRILIFGGGIVPCFCFNFKVFWRVFRHSFSHTCSNSVFAYFFLGRFSNVCTLSKHGIFKTHCFSRVKTLFWRNRLCRQPMRKCIFWGWGRAFFLFNFKVFWHVFWHSFSHRFLDAFLTKNMSKLTPKDVTGAPPFSIFFEVMFFCSIFVAFGVTFDRPLGPFVLILAPFWLILGPFRCPSGSYWDRFGAI